MFALLKIIQSIFKTLHSDGTPNQVAWGITVGAGLAFIPILSLHWALLFVVLVMVNISFGGGMLGWALFTPFSFALDPLFDALGRYLLITRGDLTPFWTRIINWPLMPYTQFNNTVTLGATVTWIVALPLLYVGARAGVARYRATWGPKLENSAWFKAIKASSLYNVYRLFSPE
jgi:uncharacterized protein (TIGR03546 family)